MANFGTFVMRPKEDTARDKLIPRKLVRQSRGDTKDEDVICHHSAHCWQILSIKTPLSSPSNSRIIWHVAAVACVCVKRMRFVYVCVTSDRTISNMATWPLRPRHDVDLLRGGRVGTSQTLYNLLCISVGCITVDNSHLYNTPHHRLHWTILVFAFVTLCLVKYRPVQPCVKWGLHQGVAQLQQEGFSQTLKPQILPAAIFPVYNTVHDTWFGPGDKFWIINN